MLMLWLFTALIFIYPASMAFSSRLCQNSSSRPSPAPKASASSQPFSSISLLPLPMSRSTNVFFGKASFTSTSALRAIIRVCFASILVCRYAYTKFCGANIKQNVYSGKGNIIFFSVKPIKNFSLQSPLKSVVYSLMPGTEVRSSPISNGLRWSFMSDCSCWPV